MTRTIKFVRDYTVKTKDGPTYTSGQVVKVSEESANHFVNRGAAEDYTPPAKPERKPEPKAEVKTDK